MRSSVCMFALAAALSVVSGRYLLDSETPQVLPRYAQCGGSGGNCAQFGACSNSPFEGYTCSIDDVCSAVDDSYWQCIAAPTPATPSLAQIAAYAQCGGINCAPALGSAAGDITCANAAWENVACTDDSFSCQRIDNYFWQCLPAQGGTDTASTEQPAVDDSSVTPTAADDSSPSQAAADDTPAVAITQGYTDTHQSDINPGKVKFSTQAVSSSPTAAENAPEAASAAASSQNGASPAPEDLAAELASIGASNDNSGVEASGLGMLVLPNGDDSSGDDSSDASVDETGDLDLDLLTFAFNLECLESALYSCALEGDAGPVGSVKGCTAANLPQGYVVDETKEISHAKRRHVQYLQSVLHISCPVIDLSAFTAVANAAVDVGSNQTYNALAPEFTVAGSPLNIFLAGFFLEDVTVGMYQGIIPNIVSKDLLIGATGLLVDNTYHAGTVRDVAALNAASTTGYTMTNAATNASADSQLSVHDLLNGMAQLRDVLDNTNDDNSAAGSDSGLGAVSGKRSASGLATDDNGMTFVKTPGQVLAIVLGNSNIGTSSGLFFPEGVAGSNSIFTAVS